ncbi:MAG: tetratricopeptide repeat protein [Gammaproteobacteria bacterium]
MGTKLIALIMLASILICSGCGKAQSPHEAFRSGNYDSSFKQYLGLAQSGDTDAANFLGIHYYLGLGTDKDYDKANKWFLTSALDENADAMRNLGVMYMRGHGVDQDWGRAYGWLYHAVQRNHPKAQEYLGVTADYVTPNKSMQERAFVESLIKDAKK